MRGFCRWMECADKVTMRAHSAERSSGNEARIDRTAEHRPQCERGVPLFVIHLLEVAVARADGVDQTIELRPNDRRQRRSHRQWTRHQPYPR